MHKIVPLRGLLTEMRIPQEQGTPLYIDLASTVFVAQSRGAVKKSAWIRRRAQVLTEAKIDLFFSQISITKAAGSGISH